MTKKRLPDKVVEAEPLETVGGVPTEGETQAEADIAVDPTVPDAVAASDVAAGPDPVAPPERRRRKRRLIWPIALATVLSVASWTLAQAATLPPLPVATFDADGLVTDAAQAPIDAVVPTAGPLASAKPEPFGPQLEVILPPPPPPPPPAPGKASRAQRKAAASAAASSGISTTQYCDAKYGATSSASSVDGLLAAANAERAKFGLSPLSWSSSLASSAQDWSNAMAGTYNAGNPGAALGHGMVPSPGGQNVAAAWTTGTMSDATAISMAHSGWMASPGHCKNILRASFTTMGAGTAGVGDGSGGFVAWYTTVDFQ